MSQIIRINLTKGSLRAFLIAQMEKNLPAMLGDPGSILGLGRSHGEGMATCSIILARESQGQRGLVGYNPQGHKEWDIVEQLSVHNLTESWAGSIFC